MFTRQQQPDHHRPAALAGWVRFLGEYAYAAGRAGDVDKAAQAIDNALEICDRLGERWTLAELLRVKGEIALMRRGPDAEASAADCFGRSLDCARRQGALSWELRGAMSIFRLDHGRGRGSQADLLAAKRLIDRLR